jgi:hypothetical protein
MLVFGSLLMAILPLAYFYKPNLMSIAAGTIIGVFGSSVLATAHSLVTGDILHEDHIRHIRSASPIITVLLHVVGIPLGALLVHLYGMQALFATLSAAMVLLVLPLYTMVIIRHSRQP